MQSRKVCIFYCVGDSSHLSFFRARYAFFLNFVYLLVRSHVSFFIIFNIFFIKWSEMRALMQTMKPKGKFALFIPINCSWVSELAVWKMQFYSTFVFQFDFIYLVSCVSCLVSRGKRFIYFAHKLDKWSVQQYQVWWPIVLHMRVHTISLWIDFLLTIQEIINKMMKFRKVWHEKSANRMTWN